MSKGEGRPKTEDCGLKTAGTNESEFSAKNAKRGRGAESKVSLTPASEYCRAVFDGTHATPKPVAKGRPLVTSKNIMGRKLDLVSTYNISESDYIDIQKRSAVSQWDILFSMIGSVGDVYLEKQKDIQYAIKNMGVFSTGSESKSKWLYYYLQSPAAQTHIKRYLNGAVQKFLPLGALRDFPVLPYADHSNKISAVLSALDAKIELNNKINAELESMAKTLYDYWFVQFDFPCLPPDYPSVGAGKPSCLSGAGKPSCLSGAGKPSWLSGAGKPSAISAACTYRAVGGLPIPQNGKWFVYVLLCSDDSFYIGMTDDLYRRWFEHRTGEGAKWTKAHPPVKVIHHEVFDSQSGAAARERELKTGFGRKWVKREYQKLTAFSNGGSPAHQSKLMQAGKMVHNPTLKRDIPEGWADGTLNDVGQVVGGSTPSTANEGNFSDAGIPWITPYDLSGNQQNKFITRGAVDISKAGMKAASLKKYPAGTVLLTSRAPIGYMAIARGEVTTNQGFKSFLTSKGYSTAVVFYMVKNALNIIVKHGSGSTFNEISGTVLKMVPVCLPSTQVADAYTSRIQPVFAQQDLLEQENQQLTELRDWLLPMLMNGQVRVE